MLSQISDQPGEVQGATCCRCRHDDDAQHLASKGRIFARVGGVYLSASQALCASPTALDDAGRVGLMTKTVSSAEYNKLDAAFVESATAIASPSSTSTRHANTVEKLLQEAHPTWVAELALNMAVTGCTQWVLAVCHPCSKAVSCAQVRVDDAAAKAQVTLVEFAVLFANVMQSVLPVRSVIVQSTGSESRRWPFFIPQCGSVPGRCSWC